MFKWWKKINQNRCSWLVTLRGIYKYLKAKSFSNFIEILRHECVGKLVWIFNKGPLLCNTQFIIMTFQYYINLTRLSVSTCCPIARFAKLLYTPKTPDIEKYTSCLLTRHGCSFSLNTSPGLVRDTDRLRDLKSLERAPCWNLDCYLMLSNKKRGRCLALWNNGKYLTLPKHSSRFSLKRVFFLYTYFFFWIYESVFF